MNETAVVISENNLPIYWHLPYGRSSVYLPDDKSLWDVVWEHRKIIRGIAHSHPGSGIPSPSQEDITTFSAIELALGRRLDWYITSADRCIRLHWDGDGKYSYYERPLLKEFVPFWLKQLRLLSNYSSSVDSIEDDMLCSKLDDICKTLLKSFMIDESLFGNWVANSGYYQLLDEFIYESNDVVYNLNKLELHLKALESLEKIKNHDRIKS